MRTLLYICSAMIVISLAFWAYGQNYRTQEALAEKLGLHRDIGVALERRSILNAEWAYLNRPDRLKELADMNFDNLGLLPLMPEAFAPVADINYPLPPVSPITDPIEISSDNGAQFP